MASIPFQAQVGQDTRPLVLIVDDSIDVHRLLRAKLKQEDLAFAGAETGEAGIEAAIRLRTPTARCAR